MHELDLVDGLRDAILLSRYCNVIYLRQVSLLPFSSRTFQFYVSNSSGINHWGLKSSAHSRWRLLRLVASLLSSISFCQALMFCGGPALSFILPRGLAFRHTALASLADGIWIHTERRSTFQTWEENNWPRFISVLVHILFLFYAFQRLRNFFFFLSIFALVLALHSTVYRNMSLTLASTCILIGRPLIAFAVSWFIVTNACGYNCKLSLITWRPN